MRWISHAGFLFGGFIAGAVAVWLMTKGVSAGGLQNLSSQQLGSVLLSRVSGTFVHDSRQDGRDAETGVLFYDSPVPVTDFLCRITEVNVYPHVVTGEKPSFHGTMDAREIYAMWREPDEAQGRLGPGRAQRDGCSEYRDFKHLVRGYREFDVERGLRTLALARHHAKTASLAYPVACEQRSATCDGPVVLRGIDLRDVIWVHEPSEERADGGYLRRHEVWVRLSSSDQNHGDIISIETYDPIGLRQLPDIRSVSIKRGGF